MYPTCKCINQRQFRLACICSRGDTWRHQNLFAYTKVISMPFAVVPALDLVLFYFTHQMTSGYSISLIRDPARGTSQFYLCVPAWTSASE